MSSPQLFRIALLAAAVAAMVFADRASAAHFLAIDKCRIYGFPPHSLDYAECRMNVRRFWTTGPCASAEFAAFHREYCHLNPPPFL
jgi:hypothetical protein